MNIVVGYVNTPEGEAAVEYGIAEAKLRGAKLVVVHSMVGGDRDDPEDYRRSAEAMEAVHERLHSEGIEHCTHEFVRGQQPVQDLMAAVDDHDARMIIIGIRTRSATGKFLLGSNALEILHDAKVPVVCVKRDAAAVIADDSAAAQ
ncbi:MAG TPA: universal stress protein [Acidimicrobiia bacterium]|jgi:nucleotide-binding universal stress UspA family protein|nr:universal stress protein [Acidimicrobiia bacterium]